MNCLCCEKPLNGSIESGWHVRCIKKFFGTSTLPEIELSDEALLALATDAVEKGYTVPGVQKKLSLHLISDKHAARLTLVNFPTGYILKPQVQQYPAMPEAEHLVMTMAEDAGIATVPHALIPMADSYAYITKRVDRVAMDKHMELLAMEDFCQLARRLTQDKYKGSYEYCAKLIQKYSNQKGLDLSELFLRLLFCFIVGNSDMHLKNFSLLESAERSGSYALSPAYDLLPVQLILPEDTEETALTINGKKRNITRKDFFIFAETCGLSQTAAEKMIAKMLTLQPVFLSRCAASHLPEEMQQAFADMIISRMERLQKSSSSAMQQL